MKATKKERFEVGDKVVILSYEEALKKAESKLSKMRSPRSIGKINTTINNLVADYKDDRMCRGNEGKIFVIKNQRAHSVGDPAGTEEYDLDTKLRYPVYGFYLKKIPDYVVELI